VLEILCFTFIKGLKSLNRQTSQRGGGILEDNSLKSHRQGVNVKWLYVWLKLGLGTVLGVL